MNTIFDKVAIERCCDDFFSLYDVTRERTRDMCHAKRVHTHAVAENCIYIARDRGLSDYDCDLAWLIGELHDFARFGQAVVTHTFKDSDRYNHAHFGARLLFKHGMIYDIMTNFDAVPDADKIVLEKAVHHHSDFHLPTDLTDRQRIFCDIIREADCIDIFRSIVTSGWKTIYNCTAEDVLSTDISPAVEEAFQRCETVKNSNCVTLADCRMAHIALCFVLKSSTARRRAVEQGYLQQLMDIEFFNPTVQAKFLRAKIIVEKFIEEA